MPININYPVRSRALFRKGHSCGSIVMLNTVRKILPVLLCVVILSGCGYVRMAGSKGKSEFVSLFRPSQKNERALDPEKNFYVQGRIVSKTAANVPLVVIAVSDDFRENEIVDRYMMAGPSTYYLYLPSGHYRLLVFGDTNGDGVFSRNENIGKYEETLVLDSFNEEIKGRLLIGIDIEIDPEKQVDAGFRISMRVKKDLRDVSAEGMITSLNDPIFSPKIGEIGHYEPTRFNDVVPSYFFTLEGGLDKMPVIFVHGIGGTPAEWKTLAEGLDRSRFHPWFFYYPSGERLDTNAQLLFAFMERLAGQHDQIALVSFSMGGLVSRAAVMKYKENRSRDYLSLFISISTPYGGMESARIAAASSPVLAPSWKDVAADSEFLKKIKGEPMPEHVKFYLFFGYGGNEIGESSDGAIPVRSQLDPSVQSEAQKVFGFNEDHRHVLSSGQVTEQLRKILEGLLEPVTSLQ